MRDSPAYGARNVQMVAAELGRRSYRDDLRMCHWRGAPFNRVNPGSGWPLPTYTEAGTRRAARAGRSAAMAS